MNKNENESQKQTLPPPVHKSAPVWNHFVIKVN